MVHHVCCDRTLQNVFRDGIWLEFPPVQAGKHAAALRENDLAEELRDAGGGAA